MTLPPSRIPRIIHQTWKTTEVPGKWRDLATSWRERHPGWQYRLWTDADNRALVKQHYPQLLPSYDACPYAIQRADIARYLILHRHGGVYADLDMVCLRHTGDLLDGKDLVIALEPGPHAARLGQRRLCCNAFLASIPMHPLLGELVRALSSADMHIVSHREVLESTGPIMLTRLVAAYSGKDITILPAHVVSPCECPGRELDDLKAGRRTGEILRACLARGAYAIHYWDNSWMRSLAGELSNPDPHGIPGYTFYPGMDSRGHDVANGGRDIAVVAEAYRRDNQVAGFNTDGFVKSRLLPRSQWTGMPDAMPNEGLYVKDAFHFGGRPGDH